MSLQALSVHSGLQPKNDAFQHSLHNKEKFILKIQHYLRNGLAFRLIPNELPETSERGFVVCIAVVLSEVLLTEAVTPLM